MYNGFTDPEEGMKELFSDLVLTIAVNTDNSPMEIGDRIVVWDGSHNEDAETGKSYTGIDELFRYYSGIIIDNNIERPCKDCEFSVKHGCREYPKNLDLLVAIGGRKVYVASSCVKHI
jgi:hypothetical protein